MRRCEEQILCYTKAKAKFRSRRVTRPVNELGKQVRSYTDRFYAHEERKYTCDTCILVSADRLPRLRRRREKKKEKDDEAGEKEKKEKEENEEEDAGQE